ncbi:hypothetical protein [uncultured Brachybacterium sp.]|uniref:Rv0361 family membrane protein n=1 Tax=uncultured Brachybacterium sp. TaxID=189680 RepID=UPI002619EA81|nr:hypothetical protein [uncultured Brachybacterium sp.]
MVYAQPPQGRPLSSGSPRPRRPMWHWLLVGGVAAVGLLVIAVFAIFIAFQVLTRGNPQETVDDFYTSLETGDCELYENSTTEQFREGFGLTSCADFEAAFSAGGTADYTVDDRVNRQGYAIFDVTESFTRDGQPSQTQVRFFVRRIDGQWDLDGLQPIDEDTPPIE